MANSDESKISTHIKHKKLDYGKRFYFWEFVSEQFIKIVSLFSICIIFAIFYYVFQESQYAFVEEEVSENKETEEEVMPTQYGVTEDSNILERNASSSEDGEHSNEPVTFGNMFLHNNDPDKEAEFIWQPVSNVPKYSLVPLVVGALKVTIISLIIATPIAILAAIFTITFAPPWLKEIIKPAIELLAGLPSVVIGFFALMTIATVIQELFDTTYRLNSFVGGIGMSLAVIPIIYTITEDALSAIPNQIKSASLALGATKWQTAWKVVLPAAAPGIFAAIILGFGRAFGETMIALMATGNAAITSIDIFDSVRTLAATIGSEMAEVEFRGIHYGVLFFIGSLLFISTFTLNAIAEFYVKKKLMKKFQGE